jgi:hypothetical protein
MGSAKHIRNNGEHLNIHGHDNYQMPGAYKQMGDQNQNQSIGAYKLVGDQAKLDKNGNGKIDGEDFKMMQPGKISGGAAKYIKESYGASKADYDKDMAEERIQIKDDKEKIYQDDKEKKESGANKITDPETDPSPPTAEETAKSINKFSKSVYDAGYNATRGRGAYVNRDGSSLGFDTKNDKTKPGLPKGVFQDYLGSGGNKNPRVAKDILSRAARFATSETGMKNFVAPNSHSYDRSHYSPTEQFRGVDTQTGKAKTFMSMGGTPEVTKHSDAFRENMKFGISRSGKTAQEGNEIKQKGLVNAPKPKASVLEKGPNKGVHSSKSKGINKILKQYK